MCRKRRQLEQVPVDRLFTDTASWKDTQRAGTGPGALSAPVSAFAQAGALAGQVLDTAGDPLPGVTVEVTDPLLIDPSRRSVTNAQGRYRIPDLRLGLHHTVTFKLPGFSTVARDVELSAGAITVVDAELSVGTSNASRRSTASSRISFASAGTSYEPLITARSAPERSPNGTW